MTVPRFDRSSFSGSEPCTRIGAGSLGAKTAGLLDIRTTLERAIGPSFEGRIGVEIPRLTAIGTEMFDRILEDNGLLRAALVGLPDEQIARQLTKAELPADLIEDLRALLTAVRTPLAVRSSSLLEDDLREPLAGAYATKMIPNSAPDLDTRLGQLARAVQHVYASTFFAEATAARRAATGSPPDEKMAVLIQQVVGTGQNGRFYPHVSGVARSSNFYPLGIAKPSDGSVSLALGLGRTIVDEGIAWSYSPACPQANPPYAAPRELLGRTQTEFWAIELAPRTDEGGSASETEHLGRHSLADAELDGTLGLLASTYDPEDDRFVMGLAQRGQRLLDFAPILKANCIPLNALVRELLRACEQALGTLVELEFALTMGASPAEPARFGLLQVRTMMTSRAEIELSEGDLVGDNVLVASAAALGNGRLSTVQDIVYLEPAAFDPGQTRDVAAELEVVNQGLVAAGRPYLLVGFGRWGSSDPTAGVPVKFGQISGAKVIVEATLPHMDHVHSQGTHFFHNLQSFEVLYFSVHHTDRPGIDWTWLGRQPASAQTGRLRHVRLGEPLDIKVDGRTGRGVILHA